MSLSKQRKPSSFSVRVGSSSSYLVTALVVSLVSHQQTYRPRIAYCRVCGSRSAHVEALTGPRSKSHYRWRITEGGRDTNLRTDDRELRHSSAKGIRKKKQHSTVGDEKKQSNRLQKNGTNENQLLYVYSEKK